MKFALKLLLFIFIAFLCTPTIISILSDAIDNDPIVYSLGEDESDNEIKVEVDALISDIYLVTFSRKLPTKFYDYLLKHISRSKNIISPPPDNDLLKYHCVAS